MLSKTLSNIETDWGKCCTFLTKYCIYNCYL